MANSQYQNDQEGEAVMFGGVVFPYDFDYRTDGSIPSLDYTLRMGPTFTSVETELVFPWFQLPGPGYGPSMYQEFIKFQNLIDLAYIQLVTKETVLPESLAQILDVDYVSCVTLITHTFKQELINLSPSFRALSRWPIRHTSPTKSRCSWASCFPGSLFSPSPSSFLP